MSADNPWFLVSLTSGDSRVPRRGQRFTAPESDAIELVAEGVAWPNDKPLAPPRYLLSLLQEQISNVDLLGPTTTDPGQQSAIAQELFRDGIRQHFAGDRAIHWCNGKAGLRELVGRPLSAALVDGFDLFFLLRFVTFATPSRWPFPSQDCSSLVYGQEYARETPADLDDPSLDLYTSWDWLRWSEVIFDALCLQGHFEDVLTAGLSDGRILVAEQARAGERFIPASVAADIRVSDFTLRHSFALSSDLPGSLLERAIPLDFRRKQAARMMKAIHDYYAENGRVVVVEALQTLMMERYGLSANAARDAWREANVPSKSGNIPRSQKVEIGELRALKIIEGEKGDPVNFYPG